MAGEGAGAGVVEDDGDGQGETGGPLEPAMQVHGGQRVESEVEEGAGRVAGHAVAEDGGDLFGHNGAEDAFLLGHGASAEPPCEFRPHVCGAAVRGGVAVPGTVCEFLEVAHCFTP
ncbi:hypothetical protein SALBM311S_10846 [Streptomyces alboniger]